MSWPIGILGEECDVRDGTHDSPKYQSEGIPLVTSKNLVNGSLDFSTANFITDKDHQQISKRSKVDVGDILYAMIGTVGNPVIVDTDIDFSIKNVGLIKFKENSKIYNRYMIFALSSDFVKKQILRESKGGTQKFVSLKVLRNLQIPLPPLPVQKKIAAALEKADTLRGQCQQMEQELNALAQSVFLDMFGDPVANLKMWPKRKINELVADFKGGKSITASENQENSGLNRVLKISAVTRGEFKPSESKPLPNTYQPPEEHFVKVNDLLFSRANTTELVGATSLVFETPDNVLLPDKLWRFVWRSEKLQSQVFMWQLLSNKSVRVELGKISSGSGGSMKNISKGKLYDFEIIYPDIEKQLEFEKIFLKVRSRLSCTYKLKKEYLDNFNSLMQRAFKGELTLKELKDVA